jgi:hypothetical protein
MYSIGYKNSINMGAAHNKTVCVLGTGPLDSRFSFDLRSAPLPRQNTVNSRNAIFSVIPHIFPDAHSGGIA